MTDTTQITEEKMGQATYPVAMIDISRILRWSGKKIRVYGTTESPWFHGADLAKALGYTNTTDGVGHAKAKQKCIGSAIPRGSTERPLNQYDKVAVFVNEGGLYRMIFKSTKDEADAFQDWVTDEVLPSIRKTGSYQVDARLHTLQSELADQRLLTDQTARLMEEQKKIAADAQLKAETEQKRADDAENDKKELVVKHELETKDKDATIAAKDTQITAKDKILDRLTVVKDDFVKDKQKLGASESIYIMGNFMLWKEDTFKVGSTKNQPVDRAAGLNSGIPPSDPLIVLYEFKCHSALPLEKYIHNALSSQRLADTRELFVMPLDHLHEFVRDIVDADRQIIALGNEHISATYASIIPKGAAAEARYSEIKAEALAQLEAKLPSITNLRAAEATLLDDFARKVIADWKSAQPAQTGPIEFDWLPFQPTLLAALKVANFATSKYKAREWKTRIAALWNEPAIT